MELARGERIQLRELEQADTRRLSRILADPQVMEYSTSGPLCEDQVRQFIEYCRSSYERRGFGQWGVVLRETGALIGCCGLSDTVIDRRREVELGYRFAVEYWGMGLATEAASLALRVGFDRLALPSIVAIVAPEHEASKAVLRRVGFTGYRMTRYRGWDVRVYRRYA